jgi:hypothetical protein
LAIIYRFDIDAELNKVDEKVGNKAGTEGVEKSRKPAISETINATGEQ